MEQTLEELSVLATACALGATINIAYQLMGFSWMRSTVQRLISVLLPATTTVITWAISSNFMLSLGMIGALSIVRYRTPVRSPLELSLLFVYVTLGIATGVTSRYAVTLTVLVILTPLLWNLIGIILPVKEAESEATDQDSKGGNSILTLRISGEDTIAEKLYGQLPEITSLRKFEPQELADGGGNIHPEFEVNLRAESRDHIFSLKNSIGDLATIKSYSITSLN